MKICILGDTHFGVRNDSKIFHSYIENFYTKVFFPTLRERNIKMIFQFGDLFDRRKYINFYTLEQSKRYFFDVLKQEDFYMYTLLGNHDIFWREKLTVNSPALLLEGYKLCVHIIDKPTLVGQIDIIPWICKENEEEITEYIKESTRPYCFGHFELKGFEMSKGIENHEGMDHSTLAKYKQVFSGHFHTKSTRDNIMYLGTPYELFWNDFKDPKGFFIWDTITNEIEFIQNPEPMFVKLFYDDTQDQMAIDYSCVTNKYVKLIVTNKKDFKLFDTVVDTLYNHNPAELKIIEDMSEFESEAIGDEVDLEDTVTLLSQYVESLDTDANKDRIKTLMKTLYVEAQNYEEK